MADEPRDRYLSALDALLPMPPTRRAEIIEEINAHLDDAVADGIQRGLPADRAESDAEARLGAPGLLARELARPEQSAWRLLAAAGAGVRTGIGQGLYGYLLGWLLLFLGLMVWGGVGQLIGNMLGAGWSLQTVDQGWNSLLTAGALGVGLYFAGRAVPETVSITSRRPYPEVRVGVVATVTGLLFAILVFAIEVPHNWASIVIWIVAPFAFALGAYRPGLLPQRMRAPWIVLIALLLLVPLMGLLGARSQGGASVDPPAAVDGPLDHGVSMAGPIWTDDHPVDGTLFTTVGSASEVAHGLRIEWQLAEGVSLAGLTHLRAEAWRADPDSTVWRLDPRFDEPFAVAAVARNDDRLTANLVTTNEPGVSLWELILTGVGPDGRRYVLDWGAGEMSTFTGTVWDWAVAVLS